jgi:hypothetical protein
VRRLRPLSEAECYVRCYGSSEPTVRIVELEPRPPRFAVTVTGEELRRSLEARLDARPDDFEAEIDAGEAAAEAA